MRLVLTITFLFVAPLYLQKDSCHSSSVKKASQPLDDSMVADQFLKPLIPMILGRSLKMALVRSIAPPHQIFWELPYPAWHLTRRCMLSLRSFSPPVWHINLGASWRHKLYRPTNDIQIFGPTPASQQDWWRVVTLLRHKRRTRAWDKGWDLRGWEQSRRGNWRCWRFWECILN